uniref:Putative ovule protein n=1 Tax=Solanum chacoense TaxID=4108 RepID=A0A0V0HW66_SOLCH
MLIIMYWLCELKSSGAFFTWNNKQGETNQVYSRIDRVLVNEEWIATLPGCTLELKSNMIIARLSLNGLEHQRLLQDLDTLTCGALLQILKVGWKRAGKDLLLDKKCIS